MRKLTVIFISLAAVLACLALFQRQPSVANSESNPSSWIANQLIHRIESEDSKISPRSHVGAYCASYTFTLKTKPISQPINYPTIDSDCAVYTSFGIADGNNLHEYGEKYAGVASTGNGAFNHWLPNSGDLIVIRNSFSQKNFRIYPDFIKNTEPKRVNNTFNTYQSTANYITAVNSADQHVNVDTNPLYASNNNQWTLAYSPNRGSVRINLETGESLIFGRTVKPAKFAISDNGRYAIVHYLQSKDTLIYDLDSCTQMSANINNPWNCQSRDITGYISDNFGQINKVERFRFLGSNHLEFIINQTEDSKTKYTNIQLTPSDQLLSQNNSYIAMGDSFASGEGDLDDSWYELGTDEPENKCHLSRRSYPYLIDQFIQLDEFHSVACSGAETNHILNEAQNDGEPPSNNSLGDWLPGISKQVNYLQVPQFITLSIGGNDVGFKLKLINCLLPTTCNYADDLSWRTNTAKEIAGIHKILVDVFGKIIAKTEQNTKVYAVGYPQIVKAEGSCGLNVHLDEAERGFVFEATKYMNQVIASAASKAGAYYLDAENALDGYNLCSGADDENMAVNGISFSNTALSRVDLGWIGLGSTRFLVPGVSESFHPNHNGHQLLASQILDLTGNNPALFKVCESVDQAICPRDSSVPSPDTQYWGEEAESYVEALNAPSYVNVKVPPRHRKLIVDGAEPGVVKIVADNLEPNSSVRLEVHSTPVVLGHFTADASGLLEVSLPIPESVEPGFHTLRLFGTETAGDPVEYYEHILVSGPDGDIDADGILDRIDPCAFVQPAGVDLDEDGIDDSCDGFIEPTTIVASQVVRTESETLGIEDETGNNSQQYSTDINEQIVYVSNTNTNRERRVVVNDYESQVRSSTDIDKGTTSNNLGNYPKEWVWFVVAGMGLFTLSYLLRRYSISS